MPREFDPIIKQITQETINRYAVASGDHNPLHVDEEFAEETPFGGTIAHGMLVLAYVNELAAMEWGEMWLGSGSLKAKFKAPAKPGDVITVSAQERRDGSLQIECRNQNDELIVLATAKVTEV